MGTPRRQWKKIGQRGTEMDKFMKGFLGTHVHYNFEHTEDPL